MKRKHLEIFGACGILSAVLLTAAYLAGEFLRPGYSGVRQAISELIEAGAPNKTTIDVILFFFHALVIPFAYGLHRGIDDGRGSVLGPVLLGGAGLIGVVLTAFFPCDPGCEPVTVRGTMHIFLAIPMGFMVLFAILAFSRRLRKSGDWSGYGRYSLFTFAAGLVLGILSVVLAKSAVGGLVERLISASYQQWYIAMGVTLIRRGSRPAVRT